MKKPALSIQAGLGARALAKTWGARAQMAQEKHRIFARSASDRGKSAQLRAARRSKAEAFPPPMAQRITGFCAGLPDALHRKSVRRAQSAQKRAVLVRATARSAAKNAHQRPLMATPYEARMGGRRRLIGVATADQSFTHSVASRASPSEAFAQAKKSEN